MLTITLAGACAALLAMQAPDPPTDPTATAPATAPAPQPEAAPGPDTAAPAPVVHDAAPAVDGEPPALRGSRVVAALAGGSAALAVALVGTLATAGVAVAWGGLVAAVSPFMGILWVIGLAALLPVVVAPPMLLTGVAAPLAGWLVGTLSGPRRVPMLAALLAGALPSGLGTLAGAVVYEALLAALTVVVLVVVTIVYLIVAVMVAILTSMCGGDPQVPPLDWNMVRLAPEDRGYVWGAAVLASLAFLLPALVGQVAGVGGAAAVLAVLGRGLTAREGRFHADLLRVPPEEAEPLEHSGPASR